MKTALRALAAALLALAVGCSDFDKAEQDFCTRNPDRCGQQPGDGGPDTYSQLAFSTEPQTLQTGSCSSVTTVQLRDSRGAPVSVATDTVLTLSATPAEGFQFFTDSSCTGATATAVSVRTGSSSTSFYFKGTRAGSATLSASVGGLSATQGVTLTPAPADSLALTVPTAPVAAGTCTLGTIQVKDANGADTQVSTQTPVNLESLPSHGVAFYSDAACTTPAANLTLAATQGSATFYFQGQVVGTVTLSALATGLPVATQDVVIAPGTGNRLVFLSQSQTVTAGTCSSQVQIQSQDAQGNAVPVPGPTAVSLEANPSMGFQFFTSANCSGTPVTTVTLPANASTAGFSFKGTVAGSVSISVAAPGFTGRALTETIKAGPPAIISLIGPTGATAGSCSSSAVSAELKDAFGNPTTATTALNLALTTTGKPLSFSTSNTCSPTTTSVVINQDTGTTSFYFKGTQAGVSTINASSGSLTGTLTVTLSPDPSSALVFTTAPQTLPAGNCSSVVTVQAQVQGSANPVGENTTVTLSASPSAGVTFYSSANCATAVNQVTILKDQSSTSFYFKGTTTGNVVLTAASGGMTSANQIEALSAAPASRLVFNTPPRTTEAGACSATIGVQSVDAYGNSSPVASSTVITLQANGTQDPQFKFYSDANCTTGVSSISLPAGQLQAAFFYQGTRAGTVKVTVSATTHSNSSQDNLVVAASPSALAFSANTPPSPGLLAGTCALRTLVRQDAFGNLASDASALTINLSGSTEAEFFTGASCTGSPVSAVSIAAGSNSVDFSFKGYHGGNNATAPLMLKASSDLPVTASQTETIIPTVRSGTCTMGGGGSNTTCTITPPLASTRSAFLVFQALSPATGSADANIRCRVSSTSQVTCTRNGTSSSATIWWSVAEFPTGVATQSLDVTCASTTTNVTLSSVTMAQSFLLLSSERAGFDQSSDKQRLAELIAATQAQIRKTVNCSSGDVNSLQVVDYSGAAVQRGVTSMPSGSVFSTASLSVAVAPSRSILLYSYNLNGGGTKSCDQAIRGELTNTTTVSFSRGEGDPTNCSSSQVPEISWEVVQFPVGTTVQQIKQQLTGTSALITLGSSVDPSRTILIVGGQWASGQVHGEGKTTADAISDVRAQASLVSDSTVSLTRTSSNSTATFTVYVVQLKP